MAEWLKAHAWKACIPQGIQGSNPCLSAMTFCKFLKTRLIRVECCSCRYLMRLAVLNGTLVFSTVLPENRTKRESPYYGVNVASLG